MYRVATLSAYDAMDQVHVSATVRLWDGFEAKPSDVEFNCATTVQGVGSAEGREWLRDALVGMIEAL